MAQVSEFLDYVIDQLEPLGGVAPRRMFGGYGLFRDGVMFAIVASDTLYFKVDDNNLADFEAAGAPPFTYEREGKRIALSYYEVPADVMDDADDLCAWARKAVDTALAASADQRTSGSPTRA
ncbi:MAG: TfoX/Sxy family protein [Alphaproteobacteria bacterium]